MPLPKPREDEEQSEFISRCHSELAEEYTDTEQRNAICFGQWERKGKAKGLNSERGEVMDPKYAIKFLSVKFAGGSEDIIEGLGAPFGGPFNGRDLSGEFFSPKTDFVLDWFPDRPLLYHHGLDSEVALEVVGRVKGLEVKAEGLWVQAQLDKQAKYFAEIKQMITKDRLFFSSGAMAHLVKKDRKSGEIGVWPLVEMSLTPTPDNLLATLDFATADKHYKMAGIELPESFQKPVETVKVIAPVAEPVAKVCPCCCHGCDCCDGGAQMPGCECCCHSCTCCEDAGQPLKARLEAVISDTEGPLKAVLDAAARDALSGSDFAYIDSEGGQHLPIHDAAHVRAAMGGHGWSAQKFESPEAKKAAAKKIIAAAKRMGIMMADDSAIMMATKAVALEGTYEDLRTDLQEQLNPSGPFNNAYTYIVATYPTYAIACRCENNGNGEETYWRIEYEIVADGKPKITNVTQVEQTYQPVAPKSWSASFSLDARETAQHLEAFAQRTKDLSDRRIKEGRTLSTVNRQLIAETMSKVNAALLALQTLLDATDRIQTEQAKAAFMSSSESIKMRLRLANAYLTTL